MSLGDPGLQPQRTALAWRRTGLAVVVNAALVLRMGLQARAPAVVAAGGLLLMTALATVWIGASREQALARAPAPSAPSAGLMLATAATACLCGLAALASVIAVTRA